jgi:hypothetical protein
MAPMIRGPSQKLRCVQGTVLLILSLRKVALRSHLHTLTKPAAVDALELRQDADASRLSTCLFGSLKTRQQNKMAMARSHGHFTTNLKIGTKPWPAGDGAGRGIAHQAALRPSKPT